MAPRTARIFALAVALLALGVSGAGAGGPARAGQVENRAGLIVQFTESDVRTYCLAFEGESISGLDLLLKTGLDLKVEAFGAMGAQVCKIDATGCDYPGEPCVCQSYGPDGVYWSYHHLRDGTWRTSILGASSYTVRPGEVEGWAWSGGAPPAQTFTFEQICPAAAPPVPTATQPRPGATATPVPAPPTATPPPPATPTPQATSTQPPVPPADTPTTESVPTETAVPAATATPSPPTSTATTSPTATSTPSPTTPSPTPTAAAAGPSGEDAARYIGLAVGAAVLGGLAVWGGLRVARGRQRSGGDVG